MNWVLDPGMLRFNGREANALLEYDRWFRGQVQSTLDRMARGEEKRIPHDEVWEGLEAYACELVAKRDADKAMSHD